MVDIKDAIILEMYTYIVLIVEIECTNNDTIDKGFSDHKYELSSMLQCIGVNDAVKKTIFIMH